MSVAFLIKVIVRNVRSYNQNGETVLVWPFLMWARYRKHTILNAIAVSPDHCWIKCFIYFHFDSACSIHSAFTRIENELSTISLNTGERQRERESERAVTPFFRNLPPVCSFNYERPVDKTLTVIPLLASITTTKQNLQIFYSLYWVLLINRRTSW